MNEKIGAFVYGACVGAVVITVAYRVFGAFDHREVTAGQSRGEQLRIEFSSDGGKTWDGQTIEYSNIVADWRVRAKVVPQP